MQFLIKIDIKYIIFCVFFASCVFDNHSVISPNEDSHFLNSKAGILRIGQQ